MSRARVVESSGVFMVGNSREVEESGVKIWMGAALFWSKLAARSTGETPDTGDGRAGLLESMYVRLPEPRPETPPHVLDGFGAGDLGEVVRQGLRD